MLDVQVTLVLEQGWMNAITLKCTLCLSARYAFLHIMPLTGWQDTVCFA
jgi:hypothetical protein